MSIQLIEALKVATEHMMVHRRALRQARVLLRVYPQGLVFACHVSSVARSEAEVFDPAQKRGYEEVPWADLPDFDAEKAKAVVDRVCAPAHALLKTTPPGTSTAPATPKLRVVK